MAPDDPNDDATRLTPAPPPADDATQLTPSPGSVSQDAATVFATDPGSTKRPTPVRVPHGESGPLTIGDRFGRYTIVRLLGMGGMGAVYQAWDEELEVVVALKVIRPEAIRDPGAAEEIERRFKRELLLARQVTHKNVVRIHDLGEINSIKYITMSYVDGTDLATLWKTEGRLPIARVLHIMKSVVSGLVAAHKAGVVHRDLKPANIMIDTDGEALIMDFGIARSAGAPNAAAAAVVAAPSDAGTMLQSSGGSGRLTDGTVLGAIVGTVEYMAPEQARGEAVDHRADLYTTGLILYDLLTGRRRAAHAGSAVEQLQARIQGELPSLKSVAPDVPDALAAVVTRATETDQAKRFQNTEDLAAALAALDDRGIPLPVKRVVGMRLAAAGLIAAIGISFGTWYFFFQTPPPPVAHDPVSVVIADFENRTGDPAFDRTLEPMLRRALEGAGFITAFDRNGIRRVVGAALPEKLDEAAAREIAVKQGLGYVLSGSIEKQGRGFSVAMKATQAVTGTVVSDVKARAGSQDQVVPTATQLVSSVRQDLGDTTTESDPIFAKASLSANSLEVVRYYAAAMEATSNNRYEDARAALTKAVEIDPKFGAGYLVLAGVSRNMGRPQDALEYIKQALSHLDGMTERERLTTRGMYFRLTGDYKQCVSQHEELIARFAADVVGRNQLALCASYLRKLDTARTVMQGVVDILPNRAVFRDNLAIYSNYAGDFATGEQEATKVINTVSEPDAQAMNALALSLSGQGRIAEAADAYRKIAPVPGLGASYSASGLGDVAIYEGRFSDAVRMLEDGAAADIAAKVPARAAAKLAQQAYANLQRGQKAAAVASATKALALNQAVKIRFLVARTYIEAGQPAKAKPLMDGLAAEVQPEPQAYGKILEALVAINSADARPAVKLLTDANELFNTWIGHYDLGRAYLATKQYPQADSAFDLCLKRRGEALSLFLDEEPTYGYFPSVQYYLGRTREGIGIGGAEPYKAYLAIREKAGEDPLIADVKKRIK